MNFLQINLNKFDYVFIKMGLENLALADTSNFPIRHVGNIHNGKVRSVYWLDELDSRRLIDERYENIPSNTQLGIMIISDRISAFDCNWKAEQGLKGVPGKGASLNSISEYWFNQFDNEGLAGNHILETPHPLVWVVERAEPILVEAIGRQYITGSMLRDYKKGVRNFCGVELPDGLRDNQKLPELLITPTTKGILKGIQGIPEKDDTNITKEQINKNYSAFGFKSSEDVSLYENLLRQGFDLISKDLESIGQIFVDTKFEFGYTNDNNGNSKMIYIDEIGTPDSSRIWDKDSYYQGKIVENSKEGFRQFLLNNLDGDILLNSDRMPERKNLSKSYYVPVERMMEVSDTYKGIAEKITGIPVPEIKDARSEILDSLNPYGVII
jgi:phosphoribosylaminoimidazole-succinocarboxamide synthase